MRFIDADKLKEECYKFTNDVSRSAMAFVQGQINAAPTADVVEVRHGEWLSVEADVRFKCSVCDAEVSTSWDYEDTDMFKYCPCCGAKMDGERRGE